MANMQRLINSATHLDVVLKLNNNSISPYLAFAEVHFFDNQGNVLFKVKGFRVKRFSSHSLTVDFPSYQTGDDYRKAFIAEGEMFGFIKDCIMVKYQNAIKSNQYTSGLVDDIINT